MNNITELAHAIRVGSVTSRQLVEAALEKIDDQDGEGGRTFMKVWHKRARATADQIDRFQLWKDSDSPLCGMPISVKDVFDVAGEVTRAGSTAREDAEPAKVDADAVTALRASGAVLVGRTTMSEFAFSGIGINKNFGTPLNPWDRQSMRIAGGSSSGSAVSVSDRMCVGALASDTGGSIRAPAALCGLTGFKPTASRVSLRGVFPRSYSLDTAGPIANSVSCCWSIFNVLSGAISPRDGHNPIPLGAVSLGVVDGEPVEALDNCVEAAYSRALTYLGKTGVRLSSLFVPEIARIRSITSGAGISPPEAYAIHRELVEKSPELIDPIFLARLLKGREARACDYVDALKARSEIMIEAETTTRPFDAILVPACPVVAPKISEVDTPTRFERMSALILRNCNLANFLDRPAISIPIHQSGDAPVGMMLIGHRGQDEKLLSIATTVEAALRPGRV